MASTDPIRVTIFNQSYSLVVTGDAREVEEVAQMVDDLMTSISLQTRNPDPTRAAVSACLHLADQLRGLRRELEDLRSKVDTKAKHFTLLLDDAIKPG